MVCNLPLFLVNDAFKYRSMQNNVTVMYVTIFFFSLQTLSVEFFHLDELGTSNDEMKEYMISQGYRYHSTVTAKKNHANDYIFVRNDLKT